jgi:shikimate kinase
MKRILITGLSGTGKSTVIDRLASLGHRAIDADSPEWSEWAPMPAPGSFPGLAPELDWIWREERMRRLLDTPGEGVLYVSGCAANQGTFYDRFEHVVLLSAPPVVLLDRVATRTTNTFGRAAGEREKILADLATVEPLLRAGADLEIDTADTPLDEVVTALLALGEGRQPPS